MGNGASGGRRRAAVEERLTRPQRLARRPSDIDYRKLRRLILAKKLAPCFDALEEPHRPGDLEECPICYFYYPSLNRSRCCAKGICTECFLQVKPSDSTRQVQCPFCKTPCYAVEYRGAKSDQEKDIEAAEEQKVIEAKIRMQNQIQDVERVIPLEQTQSLFKVQSPFSNSRGPSCGDCGQTSDYGDFPLGESVDAEDCYVSSTCNRHGPLDVDLEEVMVMEAIWQSHQDSRLWNECNQISRSSSTVDLGSGTYDAMESGICLTSMDQTDLVCSDPLTERVAVSHANSNAYHTLLEESDATGSEYNLASADFIESDEDITAEPTEACYSSRSSMPSTSDTSYGFYFV